MKPLPKLEGDQEKALLKALRMLKASDKLSAEMEARLIQAGFDRDTSAQTVQILIERRLIDDERTVRAAVEKGLSKRGLGKDRIRQELIDRGADETLVEACLAEREGSSDVERALAILDTKHDKNTSAKAARFLASRGFSEDAVAEALAQRFGDAEA